MISSENAHCSSGRVVPSFWLSGPVNSVQTYCGLEIAIMAITPRMSWVQRLKYQAFESIAAAVLMRIPPTDVEPAEPKPRRAWTAAASARELKFTTSGSVPLYRSAGLSCRYPHRCDGVDVEAGERRCRRAAGGENGADVAAAGVLGRGTKQCTDAPRNCGRRIDKVHRPGRQRAQALDQQWVMCAGEDDSIGALAVINKAWSELGADLPVAHRAAAQRCLRMAGEAFGPDQSHATIAGVIAN